MKGGIQTFRPIGPIATSSFLMPTTREYHARILHTGAMDLIILTGVQSVKNSREVPYPHYLFVETYRLRIACGHATPHRLTNRAEEGLSCGFILRRVHSA